MALGALRAVRVMSAGIALLAAVVAVAGCCCDLDGLPFSIALENRTDEAISVIWHRDSGEQVFVARDVRAGLSAYMNINAYGGQEEVCGDGELVAVDAAGREVARRPMLCTHWVIESSEAPT